MRGEVDAAARRKAGKNLHRPARTGRLRIGQTASQGSPAVPQMDFRACGFSGLVGFRTWRRFMIPVSDLKKLYRSGGDSGSEGSASVAAREVPD